MKKLLAVALAIFGFAVHAGDDMNQNSGQQDPAMTQDDGTAVPAPTPKDSNAAAAQDPNAPAQPAQDGTTQAPAPAPATE